MSSVCRKASAATALAASLLAVPGCERESRRFDKAPVAPDARAQAGALASFTAGPPGRGLQERAAAGGYDERSAWTLAQGKRWYRWFNCIGCHAQGGGGSGPALMDAGWTYGKTPGDIFTTLMDGRPNGMPAFRGRIPEEQAWQIVAYVRSLSGLVPSDAATHRADEPHGAEPEELREPTRPEDKR
ncbi:MAG: cytochrome c [Burkholderiales bacterium]|jgi:cytochrome c oxidase cbb3-type subunit 3|nr:cytochrome c [Burkholderiales bacterium]